MSEDAAADETIFARPRPGRAGNLFVIAAPSGAGKSTLIARAMPRLDHARFSVSWTTRTPRPGEVNGRDYHFVDRPTFEKMLAEGGFLEWAEVHGELYGTGRDSTLAMLEHGFDLVLDIDVQGAAQVREGSLNSTSIFILPPSLEILKERLEKRGTESEESLVRRIAAARSEMEQAELFDYRIVNDDLERALGELLAIFARGGGKR